MKRDKYRFKRFFHAQIWWQLYYSEFNDYRRDYYEDGGLEYDTREEYERAFNKSSNKAAQYADEVCGRL